MVVNAIKECVDILRVGMEKNFVGMDLLECGSVWEKLKALVPIEVIQWKKNKLDEEHLTRVQLVLEALEYACFLQVHLQNIREFEICWCLLEPLYIMYSPFPLLSGRWRSSLYAFELLKLLVDGERAGDFHVLLQRLSPKDLKNPDIIFVIKLKEFLMSGNYKKSLDIISEPPNPKLQFLCQLLIGSIRRAVADSLTNSLVEISCSQAKKLLNLHSDEMLNKFIVETNDRYESSRLDAQILNPSATGLIQVSLEEQGHLNRGYRWDRDGDLIRFVSVENQASKTISVEKVESNILGYIAELERIV